MVVFMHNTVDSLTNQRETGTYSQWPRIALNNIKLGDGIIRATPK